MSQVAIDSSSPTASRSAHLVKQWIFQTCDPRLVPVLRIGFAILVAINALVWLRDGSYWFTDEGVLTLGSAVDMNNHARWSLLFYLPSTPLVVKSCLALLLTNCVLLAVGCWSRLQMACIFVWLVSFQIRNPIICDAEDTLFRCFAFYMIFLPLDCGWSVSQRWRRGRGQPIVETTSADTWAIMLMRFQMIVIYASATWTKAWGSTWQDGTALYYVSHMHDLFGRIPAATPLFDNLLFVKVMTWSVVAIEGALPLLLLIPRTRLLGVVLGIALHLGIELTMNLFLFEWLMILGLLSFLASDARARPS